MTLSVPQRVPPLSAEHIDDSVVQRAVARAAPTYHQASLAQQKVADMLLQRLSILRSPPARILELGAASGYLTRLLAKRFPQAQIIAVDRNPALMQQAQGCVTADNWRLQQADATALPFDFQSFDLVISNLLLAWMPQPAATLAYWAQFLKPEGELFFTSLGPDSLRELKQAFSGVDNYSHVHEFIDMHWLGDWMLAAGYREPVVDAETLSLQYKALATLGADLKNSGAQCAMYNRPQGLYGKNAWAQMQRNYHALRQPDGYLPLSLEVVFGHAFAPMLSEDAAEAENAAGEVAIPLSALRRKLGRS